MFAASGFGFLVQTTVLACCWKNSSDLEATPGKSQWMHELATNVTTAYVSPARSWGERKYQSRMSTTTTQIDKDTPTNGLCLWRKTDRSNAKPARVLCGVKPMGGMPRSWASCFVIRERETARRYTAAQCATAENIDSCDVKQTYSHILSKSFRVHRIILRRFDVVRDGWEAGGVGTEGQFRTSNAWVRFMQTR